MAQAELILHVLDATEPLTNEDQQYLDQFSDRQRLIIANKIDQPAAGEIDFDCISTSATEGTGIEELKDAIRATVWAGEIRADMLPAMINARHQDALRRARAGLANSITGMQTDSTLEIIAMDLRIGTNAIGEVVGQTATEDLLDQIFGQFCIGK